MHSFVFPPMTPGERGSEPVPSRKSRSFEMNPQTYLARQDRIFAAAAHAVLGFGKDFLDRWDALVAVETKADQHINGCVYLSGASEDQNSLFFVIEAKRVTRWMFKTRFLVTIHWDCGVPDELMTPVIRLCDPATEVLWTEEKFFSEPIVEWLSEQLPNKQVVGCKPGYFARIQVNGDGTIALAFFKKA